MLKSNSHSKKTVVDNRVSVSSMSNLTSNILEKMPAKRTKNQVIVFPDACIYQKKSQKIQEEWDFEKINSLIQSNKKLTAQIDREGNTCLLWVIKHIQEKLDLKLIQILLNLDADVNASDSNGDTALHWVCRTRMENEKKLQIAKLLVNAGANINQANLRAYTPLYFSMSHFAYLPLIQFLKERSQQEKMRLQVSGSESLSNHEAQEKEVPAIALSMQKEIVITDQQQNSKNLLANKSTVVKKKKNSVQVNNLQQKNAQQANQKYSLAIEDVLLNKLCSANTEISLAKALTAYKENFSSLFVETRDKDELVDCRLYQLAKKLNLNAWRQLIEKDVFWLCVKSNASHQGVLMTALNILISNSSNQDKLFWLSMLKFAERMGITLENNLKSETITRLSALGIAIRRIQYTSPKKNEWKSKQQETVGRHAANNLNGLPRVALNGLQALEGDDRMQSLKACETQLVGNSKEQESVLWTYVQLAIMHLDTRFFDYITSTHEWDWNVQNKEGDTILGMVLKSKYTEAEKIKLIEYLLRKNSDPNVLDRSGKSTYHYVCLYGYFKLHQIMLAKLDIHKATSAGTLPIHLAAYRGSVDIMSDLIKRDQTLMAATDVVNGYTLTHYAANGGQLNVLKRLSEINSTQFKTHLYTADKYGLLPLHVAMTTQNCGLINFLLAQDNRILNTPNQNDGCTALHIGIRSNNTVASLHLIKNYPESINQVNEKNNWTALHYAAHEENAAIAYNLLQHKANTAIKNTDGDTALDIALKTRHNAIRIILQNAERQTSEEH